MRRIALALLASLVPAVPAFASEHVMKVNEVALSFSGAQYVELLDTAAEPFPSDSYKLAVYDGAGLPVGQVPIDKSLIAGKTTPVLVASQPQVGNASADASLAVTLPPDGQACFESNFRRIHCLAWGNVANKLSGYGGPTDSGPAPPAAKSLGRCPTGAAIGNGTPKAANACPDTTKPTATVGARTQKLGAVLASGYKFTVRSNERGKARAQLIRRGRVVATLTKTLAARVAKSFALRPARATRDALADAMSATFTLKVVVTDAAGNARTVTRPVTVRRS